MGAWLMAEPRTGRIPAQMARAIFYAPPPGASVGTAAEGVDQLVKGDGRKAGGGVGDGIGYDKDTMVKQGAAGVDHIGHVAFAFVGGGGRAMVL